MRKYIIERDLPEVGTLEREQLRAAAAKSNDALAQLGPEIDLLPQAPPDMALLDAA